MKYPDEFSPVVNRRLELEETGKLHNWIQNNKPYYSSSYICSDCGRKSWGWNLWKEDFLKTCKGIKK